MYPCTEQTQQYWPKQDHKTRYFEAGKAVTVSYAQDHPKGWLITKTPSVPIIYFYIPLYFWCQGCSKCRIWAACCAGIRLLLRHYNSAIFQPLCQLWCEVSGEVCDCSKRSGTQFGATYILLELMKHIWTSLVYRASTTQIACDAVFTLHSQKNSSL